MLGTELRLLVSAEVEGVQSPASQLSTSLRLPNGDGVNTGKSSDEPKAEMTENLRL